jgi:hypothetical protein
MVLIKKKKKKFLRKKKKKKKKKGKKKKKKKKKETEAVVLRHFVAMFQEKLNRTTKYSTRTAKVSAESRTKPLSIPLN